MEQQIKREERICKHHGSTLFKFCGHRWRCLTCTRLYKSKKRQGFKEKLVAMFGGKCSICGYNKCNAALQFHHTDPTIKSFEINQPTSNWLRVLDEAKKCILICANCHLELHNTITINNVPANDNDIKIEE